MTDALTILVVDDSPAMRAVLGAILGAGGHEIMFAEDVDAGLEAFSLRRPDVVLTDYTMPNRTGRDLVLGLRADGFGDPIFVISSEHDPEIRAAMSRAGADRWFPKPVCAAALLEALETIRGAKGEPRQFPARPEPTRFVRFG